MKKRVLALALAALMLTGLTACGGSDTGSNSSLSGSVTALGSTSMEKVMGALAEQFNADHSGVKVTVEGGGSGAGVEAAANGTADIGLASRSLKEEEKSAGLTETILALDGIAVIVNADNPVDDLTVAQIALLFTGEADTWSAVGGHDLEVACFGRESGSGTRDGFESITGTEDECELDQELTSTGAVIEAVRGNPQAIGYASLASVENQKGIKAITVDGVACTEDTVKNGSYPIQRPFVLVTKTDGQLSDAALTFFRWATSADAADLIRQAGAVPALGVKPS